MTTAADLSELWSEKQVMERFGHLFADRELRLARKRGDIGWFALRKGPHYTPAQLWAYLQRRERKPCRANSPLVDDVGSEPEDEAPAKPTGSFRSTRIGSGTRRARMPSTTTGTTASLAALAARQLENET